MITFLQCTGTRLLEVRVVVTLGDASGWLGEFSSLIWVLVYMLFCEKHTRRAADLKFIFCVFLLNFPGLCTAESVHTEGWNWKGKYPRSQASFLHLPKMSQTEWRACTRAGSGKKSFEARLWEGFVISGPSGLFSFYFIILMCFHKSSDNFEGIPYHQH